VAEDENYKKPVSPKRQSAVDLGKARPVVKATLGHFKKLETKLHFTFQAYPGFSLYSEMPAGHKTSPRVPRSLKAARVRFAVLSPSNPPLIKVIVKLRSGLQQ
jgi:hypothetical protein